MENKEPA